MARLYCSKRGRSGSTRPISKRTPVWCKYQPEEIEALIVKLSKEGDKPSLIGMTLRDRYGVPLTRSMLGKKMSQVLSSSDIKLKIPDDLEALMKKAGAMKKHHAKNKKDYSTKRSFNLVESKIHRLAGYYRSKGVIPPDWKYKSVVSTLT